MLIDENRFTGRIISDFSSAVSSLMVDANRLNWDIQLVERAGLRLEML
jgi:sugar (pentulose or hexulose) kinase